MTPEEFRQLQFYLRSTAKILKADTPKAELQNFARIELAARRYLLDAVVPAMADFFCPDEKENGGKRRKLKSSIGEIQVSSRQVQKLGLRGRTQLSPILEKSCLVASANSSCQQAEENIALMTGIKSRAQQPTFHSQYFCLMQQWEAPHLKEFWSLRLMIISRGIILARFGLR
ncbi:MAG: hypothetical protein HC799_10620 [Limnothrix sp. RL_2_0]|nr:hypothetical protein [Limnothrix sp. RL_2_0]